MLFRSPASVKTIGESAFSNAIELSSVIFAEDSQLEIIGDNAFGATQITSFTIPASVTEISRNAFIYSSLTAITVHENNANFSSQDGILYNKNKTTLIFTPERLSGTITIPAGVETIGQSAFENSDITSVGIPASVKNIDYTAFANCTNLTSVTFAPNSQLTTIGVRAFQNSTAITSIEIPASVTTMTTMQAAPGLYLTVFEGWTVDQKIIVPFVNQAATEAVWDANWRAGCDAVIQYTGP